MDFSYITAAQSCPSGSVKRGLTGKLTPDEHGKIIPGPNIPTTTTGGGGGGGGEPPAPPRLEVTGTGDPLGGQEVNCTALVVIPPTLTLLVKDNFALNFIVTFSNGQRNWTFLDGLYLGLASWESSDDAIASFDAPGRFSQDNAGGMGYVVTGKSAGTATLTVTYDQPSTKNAPGRGANENWWGACKLTGTIDVTIVANIPTPPDEEIPDTPNKVPTIPPTVIDPYLNGVPIKIFINWGNTDANQALIEVGGTAQLRCWASYGNDEPIEITNAARWASLDDEGATVAAGGLVTGVSAGSDGMGSTVFIQAIYKGLEARAIVRVTDRDTTATAHGKAYTVRPIDTVLVLPHSASMGNVDETGLTRIERAKDAARNYIAALLRSQSQVALVTYGGTYISPTVSGDDPQTFADAVLQLQLTTNHKDGRDALNKLALRGPLNITHSTPNGRGIGSGLLAAQTEINSDRHVYGNKKVIVLLADGKENINKPSPVALAEAIKLEGTILVIIGLGVPALSSTLTSLASPGLYFESPTTYELSLMFTQIPHTIGYSEYGYGWYY